MTLAALLVWCSTGALTRAQTGAAPPGRGRTPTAAPGPARPGARALPGAQTNAREEGHETEAQTIAKCLADLKQDDVALRRRAAMVLGKYSVPVAQAAMVGCLGDPDDVVRQSALVALSEQRALPPGVQKPVIRLLVDPNVHIRRIASSLLRDVLGRARFRTIAVRPGQVRRPPSLLDAESRDLLNRALDDEDVIIKKNVLSLHSLAGGFLEKERLQKCFAEGDREVRVLALRAYCTTTNLAQEGAPTVLAPLVSDPDPVVREEVVRALERSGKHGVPLLRRLADDPEPSVRLPAIQRLVLSRDEGAFERLEKAVADEGAPVQDRKRLVRYLHFLEPVKRAEVLTQLAGEGPPIPVRAEAIRLLGALRDHGAPPALFLELLDSPSAEIRKAAVRALQQQGPRIKPDHVAQLFASEHVDVRRAALMLVHVLPAEQGADLLVDACLDDDVQVRCTAIQQACLGAVPSWQLLLGQSLKDPSIEIQRAAANALLGRNDAESRRLLTEYLPNCESPELARHIRLQLARLGSAARRRARSVPTRPKLPARPPRRAPTTKLPQQPRR